jgi:hypothetical protein
MGKIDVTVINEEYYDSKNDDGKSSSINDNNS